jgi:NAD(P)-dependent dehydrogenase (short-subunit alcohol dehydrogenase family)
MGLSTAERFVAEGAYVFITGRRQAELDKAVERIGRNVTGVRGDVANLADLDRLYAAVKEHKGEIDVLFANAGVGGFGPLGSITEQHFDTIFGINVRGLLFSVQKALPLFRDGGSIILNASIASIGGGEGMSVYSASKAAVCSFARGWTSELKGRKIRVNTLSPGPIDTPIFEKGTNSKEEAEAFKSYVVGKVPLGRIGTSEEIANVALFLASADSSFVTGIELFVDGGSAQISGVLTGQLRDGRGPCGGGGADRRRMSSEKSCTATKREGGR